MFLFCFSKFLQKNFQRTGAFWLFLRLFKIINTLLTFNYREINFWKSHLYEYFRLTCTFTYLSRSNLRLSKNWQFVSRFRSRMKRESEETIVTGNCSKTESNFRSRRLMEIGRCAGSQDERFKVGGKNEFNGSSGLTRFQASGVPARFVRPFNLASRKYQPGWEDRGTGGWAAKLCLHVPFGPCSRAACLPSWPCTRIVQLPPIRLNSLFVPPSISSSRNENFNCRTFERDEILTSSI